MVRCVLALLCVLLWAGPAAAAPPAVTFKQVGTQLSLRVRTAQHGTVCVTVVGAGRMCVYAGRRRPVVRFARAGSHRSARVRGASAARRGRVLRVHVYPRAIGLRPGEFRWFARVGRERLPASGDRPLSVSVYGAVRCFGAAARDGDGCSNPSLRRSVVPRPDDAELMPDYPCARTSDFRRYEALVPCEFGARYVRGPARLALIGDSHAMSMRAPVEVAAQALRVKAAALNEAGCGFALEVYDGWPKPDRNCHRFVSEVLKWLGAHPSVRTVVLTASSTHGYTEDGLASMWARIPSSVRHIYVVVDVPRVSYKTADCVRGVVKRHAVSDGACAVPRDKDSLPPDPEPGAVARSSDPRVKLIDLTHYFCSDTQCFPLIGGAYVYRDTNHMNLVFGATLGPFLLERMQAAA